MPELSNDMYCSQQICVPPTFPYLLRQYAKAAIRTQPTDLLKWSTAYFRCLSLNLPPPVKPRLEYPIPKDYEGITPGWLKALIYQLQNNQTVDFKVLWDRWTGACLQHQTLIQVLTLGAFDDPKAIPWLRFIALCAGHITENLTQTMILICEILTEEPEGGSSMITVEVFMDLYKFLAAIDASQFQTLYNIYFTDSLLNLGEVEETPVEAAVPKDVKPVEVEVEVEIPESVTEIEKLDVDQGDVISCPDIDGDIGTFGPTQSEQELLDEEASRKSQIRHSTETLTSDPDRVENEYDDNSHLLSINASVSILDSKARDEESEPSMGDSIGASGGSVPSETKAEESPEVPPKDSNISEPAQSAEVTAGGADPDEVSMAPAATSENQDETADGDATEGTSISQVPSAIETKDADAVSEAPTKKSAASTLEPAATSTPEPSALSIAMQPTEASEEVEPSDVSAAYVDGFRIDMGSGAEEDAGYGALDYKEMLLGTGDAPPAGGSIEGEGSGSEKSFKYEEVEVEPIPGIGSIVPPELVKAVEEYMFKVSKNQHGYVMPRNIRHYTCPPLEVFD